MRRLSITLVIAAAAGVTLSAVQAVSLVDQFRSADRAVRMQLVSEAVLGKRPASEEAIRELLAVAMKDGDPGVRLQAVGSVASILTLNEMPQLPPGQAWTKRLQKTAEGLRPELEAATRDADPRVRKEALRGLLTPSAMANPAAPLPASAMKRFASVFATDPDTGVRAWAVQAITGSPLSADPEMRELATGVLLRALEDTDPYVVQAAARGATRLNVPEALPLLVTQLKHPSYVARIGVAQGIASYGAAARRYLPELQAALAAETHDIARATLQGTITVITR